MLNLKSVMVGAVALSLLAPAGIVLAARYGDAEILHRQSIAKVQQAKAKKCVASTDAAGGSEASKPLYENSRFKKNAAS